MKRKVIKQANQAYTITLPITWVRQHKIDNHTEVEVIEQGKNLTITHTGAMYRKKVTLEVSGFEKRNLFRHINSLYSAGYDEIELTCDSDISSSITEIVGSLIGYVLVSKNKNSFIIRDVTGLGSSSIDDVFKRVFQSIIFFYESAIEDIFGSQKESHTQLKSRDLEVNKLCLYLQRSINKMSYTDTIKGRALFTYSFELERISDTILHLWRDNIDHNIKKTKELKELALLSKRCLEEAFDFYYMFNSKNLERYYESRELVRKKSHTIKTPSIMFRSIMDIAENSLDLSHLSMMIRLE